MGGHKKRRESGLGSALTVEAASGTGARTRVRASRSRRDQRPRRSRTGRELFYWQNTPASVLRSVAVPAGPDFRSWCACLTSAHVERHERRDVTPDPNRYRAWSHDADRRHSPSRLLNNWFDELRRPALPKR